MSVFVSKKKNDADKEFNDILLNVIDDAFKQIGGSFRSVVYFHLERNFIEIKAIPSNIEKFSTCLKTLFGVQAQFIIEMVIVKKLYIQIEEMLEEKYFYRLRRKRQDKIHKRSKRIRNLYRITKNQNSDFGVEPCPPRSLWKRYADE